jgi:uncharacterized membrane protein
MAGIGFELRRVLQRGGIIRVLGVSLAGTAVVAGPWLLSVLGIFLIQQYAASALTEARSLFTALIVYCYAFSLVLFSGLHYVFTRQISDLIYQHKNREAGSALASFLLALLALSAVVAAAGLVPLRIRGLVSRPALFVLAAGLLFTVINLNWVIMSFITLLKSYMGILLVYLGGMLISLLGVRYFGALYATAGALLGYTLGQCFAAVVLYLMTLKGYAPSGISLKGIVSYLSRYRLLFLAGLFYAWASWADKIVFWFVLGRRVEGSWFRAFDQYDGPTFFAILTMIPGLVFFTIETETSFYPRLRQFLRCLGKESWNGIIRSKQMMLRTMSAGVREQSVLQGICSLTLIILAPAIGHALFGDSVDVSALRLTLGAVFFHALFLTLMIFLFYFELYEQAVAAVLVFFAVNVTASLVIGMMGAARFLGLSYLAGGIAGSVAAGVLLSLSARRIDRTLFARAAGITNSQRN